MLCLSRRGETEQSVGRSNQRRLRDDNMKLSQEEFEIIHSALSCVSKQSSSNFTITLVGCAQQILLLHMNDEIAIDVQYNGGLLEMKSPLVGRRKKK
jgi:hypothetical protein